MNDDELELVMRTGLEHRALRARVDVAVVDRARTAARGRRTTRLAVVAVAAAAAVAVAVTAVAVTRAAPGPGPAERPSSPGTSMDGFRTEHWQGVQVDVPEDWGWGGTPDACGQAPAGEPYVGRPIIGSHACSNLGPDATPTAPYVWFDADEVRPGIDDLGGGYTRETVDVAGWTVSVATTDDALRARIVGSVAKGELCGPGLAGTPKPRDDVSEEGVGSFVSARVCAYGNGGLLYGEPLGERAFDATVEAVEKAPRSTGDPGCRPYEVVLVSAVFESPDGVLSLTREVVYDLTCGEVDIGAPGRGQARRFQITESTVPWAGEPFRHLLEGPMTGDDWVYDRFIGVR